MGTGTIIVGADLRARLYDCPAKHGVHVLTDKPWDGDGLRIMRILSQQLEPGDNGVQAIIVDGDGFRFKRDEPGYES